MQNPQVTVTPIHLKIRHIMIDKKLKIKAVATDSEIEYHTLCRMLRGETEISVQDLVKIARACDTHYTAFIEDV